MNADDSEMLRHAVLESLAHRHPVPLATRGVKRACATAVPFKFTDAELDSALEFLRGKNLVQYQADEMGATKWWTATSDGLLHLERKAAE